MHKNSRNTNLLVLLFVLFSLPPLLLGGCATCVRYETRYENRSRCFDHNPDGSCHYYTTESVPVEYCVQYEKSEKSEESKGSKASRPDVEFRPIEEGSRKFPSRNKPALLTKKSMAQLIMEGYVNIGDVVVRTDMFDRALQEAGRAGGDVVLHTKNDPKDGPNTWVFRMANDVDTNTLSMNLINVPCEAINLNTAAKLIHLGARVDAKTRRFGHTALISAAQCGNSDVVKLLLQKGADVNAKDEDRSTALMIAALFGHSNVVKFLLEKGADVNAKDREGKTALMRAGSNEEIRRLLKNAGARK